MDTVIRNAHVDDIDCILAIDREAFGKNHWSYTSFFNEFSNTYGTYLVAEYKTSSSTIVGYIGYWKVRDEGHITTLAVDYKYRKNHIADILLYSLINSSYKNQIKWLTLEVRVSNLPAINLYNKFMFKQIGVRKKYYQDNNEDALILWTENINSYEFKKNLNEIYTGIIIRKVF